MEETPRPREIIPFDVKAWLQKYPPPPEPQEPPTALPKRPPRKVGRAAGADRLRLARAYIMKIPGAISRQAGHTTTFNVACRLVIGFDLDPADALPLFQAWNLTCQPPWSADDLVHKLESALERRATHPNPGY